MDAPYLGNYLGIVIRNDDPEGRGRLKVFVPHVIPTLSDNWNALKNISFGTVGDNVLNSLTSDQINKLREILPWAECAAPIVGSCTNTTLASKNSINNQTGYSTSKSTFTDASLSPNPSKAWHGVIQNPMNSPYVEENQTIVPPPSSSTPPLPSNEKSSWRSALASSLDEDTKERLFALTRAEVGGQGIEAQQAFMETVFNRAYVQNKSIDEIISNKRYYACYHDGGFEKGIKSVPQNRQTLETVFNNVINGSNLTNGATQNASANVAAKVMQGGYDASVSSIVQIGGETFYSKTYEQKKVEEIRSGVAQFTPPSSKIASPPQRENEIDKKNQFVVTQHPTPTTATPIDSTAIPSGLFSVPKPGAFVWVFFQNGDPLFPVYFATAYTSQQWANALNENEYSREPNDEGTVRSAVMMTENGSGLSIVGTNELKAEQPLASEDEGLKDFRGIKLFAASGAYQHLHAKGITTFSPNEIFIHAIGNYYNLAMNSEVKVQGDSNFVVNGDCYEIVGDVSPLAIQAIKEHAGIIRDINL